MRRVALLIVTGVLVSSFGGAAAAPGPAGGQLPAAPGTGLVHNLDQEPGVAVSPDGSVWVASSIGAFDPRGRGALAGGENPPALSGSDVWRSIDGGRTYRWVAAPFNVLPRKNGFGGGDTDIAVAPVRNASGSFNVYVAGLPGVVVAGQIVTEVSLAVSRDGGKSWLVDPAAATVPADDRQWVSADGPCTVYLTYHSLPTSTTTVNKYDLCDPLDTARGVSTDTLASTRLVHLAPRFVLNLPDTYILAGEGKPIVDTSSSSPYFHRIYIPAIDCPGLRRQAEIHRGITTDPTCPAGVDAHVYLQYSGDQGRTWHLRDVATSTNRRVLTWPALASDERGTLYLAWSDVRDVYIIVSHDGGITWTQPMMVNVAPSLTAVMPAIASTGFGNVEIAWYGSTVEGYADDASLMGRPGAASSASWAVYLARSSDGGASFIQQAATGVVHTGKVCVLGTLCNVPSGERDLFDDFGIGGVPTGSVMIAYTTDEPEGDIAHDYTAYVTVQ